MRIEKLPIGKINPAKYNPRKDLQPDDTEYQKLVKSITEFSLVEPLIWNEKTGNLVGGHQRLKVLKDLGYTEVEVSVVSLPGAKEKALNIALNKISGEWDFPKLKDLLQELDTGEFDIEITGFDELEIEKLVTKFPDDGKTDDDFIPDDVGSRCKLGELWQLGEHKLLCGDALGFDISILMGNEKASVVFTDPPFEMTETGYMDNLLNYCNETILIMHSDANMVLLASKYNRIFHYFLVHYYSFGFARSKTAPQMAHHLMGVFGDAHFVNRQDGFKTVICEQMERNKLMPYQKRVEIPLQCIKHYSNSGIVLDVFGGSGSTMIACEKIQRPCYMMELDPKNCDIIIKRWEDFTGKQAINIS